MNRCPITYEECGDERYSPRGLALLAPKLKHLDDLPIGAAAQREEALRRASKMSIQGVQPKLSATFNAARGTFEIVDAGGRFILKPQHAIFPQLPENEDLTMRLAKVLRIAVPFHGLVYSKDLSLTYFIKRFDRQGKKRIAVEDFAQLAGASRDTKYDSSMEQVAKIVESYCTFPVIEKVELFRRTLFSFLVGNEDMHLKNFSLIAQKDKVSLAPAYDLLNSTIVLNDPEELALPIAGKRRRLNREDIFNYFAKERLGINPAVIEDVERDLTEALPRWREIIAGSFLTPERQAAYIAVLEERTARLRLTC